jgi:E3 ubiquitin-protein ligase HUWE1
LIHLSIFAAASEEEANHRFRDLVTLHIRVTLLSDVFSTAGYAHGRAAFGLLQTLMTNLSPEVLRNLGSLHRATIWENIILNVGLTSKGIDIKPTPPASPVNGSPNQSAANLPDSDNTAPTAVNTDAEGTARRQTPVSPTPKSTGPRQQNSVALKHITHGLPGALAPFFQGNTNYHIPRSASVL